MTTQFSAVFRDVDSLEDAGEIKRANILRVATLQLLCDSNLVNHPDADAFVERTITKFQESAAWEDLSACLNALHPHVGGTSRWSEVASRLQFAQDLRVGNWQSLADYIEQHAPEDSNAADAWVASLHQITNALFARYCVAPSFAADSARILVGLLRLEWQRIASNGPAGAAPTHGKAADSRRPQGHRKAARTQTSRVATDITQAFLGIIDGSLVAAPRSTITISDLQEQASRSDETLAAQHRLAFLHWRLFNQTRTGKELVATLNAILDCSASLTQQRGLDSASRQRWQESIACDYALIHHRLDSAAAHDFEASLLAAKIVTPGNLDLLKRTFSDVVIKPTATTLIKTPPGQGWNLDAARNLLLLANSSLCVGPHAAIEATVNDTRRFVERVSFDHPMNAILQFHATVVAQVHNLPTTNARRALLSALTKGTDEALRARIDGAFRMLDAIRLAKDDVCASFSEYDGSVAQLPLKDLSVFDTMVSRARDCHGKSLEEIANDRADGKASWPTLHVLRIQAGIEHVLRYGRDVAKPSQSTANSILEFADLLSSYPQLFSVESAYVREVQVSILQATGQFAWAARVATYVRSFYERNQRVVPRARLHSAMVNEIKMLVKSDNATQARTLWQSANRLLPDIAQSEAVFVPLANAMLASKDFAFCEQLLNTLSRPSEYIDSADVTSAKVRSAIRVRLARALEANDEFATAAMQFTRAQSELDPASPSYEDELAVLQRCVERCRYLAATKSPTVG